MRRRPSKIEQGVLVGVRDICKYTVMGPKTFYELYRHHDFPAMRLPDDRWCTSKTLVDEWIRARWKAQKADALAEPQEGAA